MPELTSQDLSALREIDTPTICNLLEIVAPQRRGYGFTFRHLHCIFPQMRPMVGYAKTATIRARMPAARTGEEAAEFREQYLKYVADGAAPRISVVQDVDEQPGYGAMWGEVFATVHQTLGVLGVVTNGSVRDLDVIPENFQLLAGLVGPSHAHIHLCDYRCEVNVHGMTVNDGDLIHADRHGAVIIPHEVALEVPRAFHIMAGREKVILDAAKVSGATVDDINTAWRNSGALYK